MRSLPIWLLVALLCPPPGWAQPAPAGETQQELAQPEAAPGPAAPESERPDRTRRSGAPGSFRLEVRGLDIDNLLKFYSDTFKLTVVKDPNCTGPVTVICPEPVTREEAISILNSILEVRGFTSLLGGALLKIVPLARAVQSKVDIRIGSKPETLALDQVMTQIVPLQQAQAVALQRELTPLISPGASLIASAASNTLIITDTGSNITRLLGIIERLDAESEQGTRVFPLQYADATSLAPIISQLVITTSTITSGTPGGSRAPWEQRLLGRMGGRPTAGGVTSSSTTTGTVLSDPRTNALIVTASPDKMQIAESVIASLDRPVPYESTVFVYSLQHAKAADLAASLNQAFGRGGTARTAATTSTTTRTQQRTTPSTRRTQPGLQGGTTSSQAPELESEEPIQIASKQAGQQRPPTTSGGTTYPRAGTSGTRGVTRDAEGRVVSTYGTTDTVTVIPESNTNSLIINAPPEQMESVKRLVLELDQVPVQVMIEAIIAELTLDATSKFGFEWTWMERNAFSNPQATGTLSTNFGLNDPKALGLRYSVVGTSLTGLLSALATDQRANILSTPRIFTANNRPAEINISQQVPYIISFRETTAGTFTYNYGYMDVGIVLQVTPQVSANGTVNLEVSQEANDLLGFTSFNAPIVARRSAQTSVSIQDGQTVVLGGIMKESRSQTITKIPLLGDLPLVGGLFRKKEITKGKTELLVFLTPRVVRTPEQARALTQQQQGQLRGVKSPTPAPLPPASSPPGARPVTPEVQVGPGPQAPAPEQGVQPPAAPEEAPAPAAEPAAPEPEAGEGEDAG